MESIDKLVIRTAVEWAEEGCRFLLATVVETWGSSPRPIGSMMALREDGRIVGSVSGGCIEDDMIFKYSTDHQGLDAPLALPTLVTYGVSAEEARRFGLPCGGTIKLMLEFEPEKQPLSELLSRLDNGELVRRIVSLQTGRTQLEVAQSLDVLKLSETKLAHTLGPGYRMLLIGAGALAEYLSVMATFNGFDVTVCDPREEYQSSFQMAGVKVVKDMPDDVVASFNLDSRSCVIALSHDPKLDDLALMEALRTSSFYVGAIGSRKNNQARRERLETHFGLSRRELNKLHGPVGIYIGSRTPAEIAVSIMAEVLAAKNGVSVSHEMGVATTKENVARKTGSTSSCSIAQMAT